ncbi:MAG TPA: PaaI family thioesterase [Candidatus Dormibacteraeota bacterium]|nr:PaaI family thioesterase [Candidatus Dormibacteraeota bacterium]
MKPKKLSAPQVRRGLRKIHFAGLLGVRLARLHRDGLTLECGVRKNLLNSAGVLHGGVSATLADAAVGVALHYLLGSHRPVTTIEMKINYFRPVSEGKIFARARMLRVGATVCVGRVDITNAQGRLIGAVMVTYMILPRPAAR